MSNVLSKIYLSSPHMSGNEQQYIEDAFTTNWIAPLGTNVDAFESEVAQYVGVEGAVALSSGTAAIHLALRLIGVSKEDTVFCSSLTFVASANPILYLGAQPVFIDSEPYSWNMSAKALKKALIEADKKGELPKAVIIVNLYGQSADYDELLNLCNQYEIPVVEDAAESLGATYKGKKSGSIGHYGIFSFNGNKIITTSGGGMLVSNDIVALEKARFWATQARDQAVHYQHSELGYNYRLSNVLAGIGRGQLQVLDDRVTSRRQVFNKYYEVFSSVEGINFMPECEYGHSTRWLTAVTIVPEKVGITAVEIIRKLAELNIEARPVWKPLHLQPLFRDNLYYAHSNYSVSDELFNYGLCLPSGSNISEDEQNRIITALLNCIKTEVTF